MLFSAIASLFLILNSGCSPQRSGCYVFFFIILLRFDSFSLKTGDTKNKHHKIKQKMKENSHTNSISNQ